ncbi:hypothetical protein [Niabella hibiscisoli]|uniref:hypothetical protein n=1 Tax=Niabella hibiscisoli TaxID=1825928 RepID=UPI001F10C981|nr:hypothetical protein [Niabella hibiscisoli]MCH5714727.1 hypothetical protein [Niabella hibiscisoli]
MDQKKLSEFKEEDESHLTFSTLLQFTEEEYKTLSLRDLPPVAVSQPHLFDNAIDKVFSKEIKGVNLIINKDNGSRFEILRKRSGIVVTIPGRTRRNQADLFDEYELKRHAKFGFEVKKKPLRFVKSFPRTKDEATNLKTFLARYYFEMLNPYPVQNQGYIEYIY